MPAFEPAEHGIDGIELGIDRGLGHGIRRRRLTGSSNPLCGAQPGGSQ